MNANINANTTYLIHSLPSELLARIFREYVDLCDFDTSGPRRVSYGARVVLSSVDYRMRMVAICTPWLWCFIRVLPFVPYPPLSFLALVIRRSGTTTPLHIDFDDPRTGHWDYNSVTNAKFTTDALRLLLPHLPRLKSLRTFLVDMNVQEFANIPLHNALSLEAVNVTTSCVGQRGYAFFSTIAKRGPSLRHLAWFDHLSNRFDTNSPSLRKLALDFPWGHIRQLELTLSMSADVMLQLFSALTSAEVVRLVLEELSPAGHIKDIPSTLICRPRLRELTIDIETKNDGRIYSVIQYLDLPNIKRLEVLGDYPKWDNDGSTIASSIVGCRDFIIRASATLQEGKFRLWCFNAVEIGILFKSSDLLRISKIEFTFGSENDSDSDLLATLWHALISIEEKKPDLRPYLRAKGDSIRVYIMGWPGTGVTVEYY